MSEDNDPRSTSPQNDSGKDNTPPQEPPKDAPQLTPTVSQDSTNFSKEPSKK